MAFFDFLSGADEQAKEIRKATNQALRYEQEGQTRAADILRPAANFQPTQSMLYDLAGVNGAQAQQNAFGRYVESPEVQWQREQGEQSAMRAAAAGGQLASGRTLADLAKYGQGLAQQGYGNYWNRLSSLYGSALGAAGGLADVYSGGGSRLANIQMGGGQQLAAAEGQRGGVLGDLLSQGAALAAYAAGGGSVGTPGSTASMYDPGVGPGGKGYPYYGGPR